MSFYAPNAVVMPANGPAIEGAANARAGMAEMFKMPNFSLSLTPVKVEVAAANDMAVEHGVYQITFDTPQGKMDNGKYLVVYKKINGEWKAAYDIYNSDRPLPGM